MKKARKKLFALAMASVMGMSLLTGCGADGGGSSADGSTSADGNASADKKYVIGICQLVEHEALDAATKGFQDALKERLGDNVEFVFQNAQNEQTNAATICNAFVADKVDLILANATSPLQAAASATADIPILGTSVTDYATALDITDWTGTTGVNISGTSDLAPLEDQEKMLLELFPDTQTVGILYCSSEPNSVYQANRFSEYLGADRVAVKVYTAADSNEIQTVASAAVQECDVIYIPTDNTMAAYTEAVNNICLAAKVPVITGEEGICRGCGVATLSISYYDLGYATGQMAYEILVNGADVSTMEIQYAPNVTKKYNAAICEELGVAIPDDYIAIEVEE